MTAKRPNKLVYENSRRVELLDAETLEPIDTFVNAAAFCRHFEKELSSGSGYLTAKKRNKINGMLAQYEGDDYWINYTLKKEQKELAKHNVYNPVEIIETPKQEEEEVIKEVVEYQKEPTLDDSVVTRICDKIGISDGVVRQSIQEMVLKILDEEIEKYKNEVKESIYGSKSFIGIDTIIKYVCERYLITPDDLQKKTRKKNICEPRQIIHWMIRNRVSYNYMSLESIGNLIGGKDHATVIHSVNVINNMIETDSAFRNRIIMMCKELGARTVWMESDKELKITGYLKNNPLNLHNNQ